MRPRAETACVGNYSEIEVAECHFSSFHLLSTLVAIFTPTSPSSYPRPLFEGRLTPPTCPWEPNGSIHRSRDPQQSLAPDPIHPMRQIQHLELLSTGAAAISLNEVIDWKPHPIFLSDPEWRLFFLLYACSMACGTASCGDSLIQELWSILSLTLGAFPGNIVYQPTPRSGKRSQSRSLEQMPLIYVSLLGSPGDI